MAKAEPDFGSRRLFDIITNSSSGVYVALLEESLTRNKPKIEAILRYFKAPSENAKKSVKSGKVTISGRELPIDDEMKGFSAMLSSICMLDEVQTVELFHNYNKSILIGQAIQYDLQFAEKVLGYYFEERSYLLRTVLALFHNVGDADHEFQSAIVKFLNPLHASLTKTLFDQLQSLANFDLPPNMDSRFKYRWALQNLREQGLILEALFFAHYDNSKYSPQNVVDAMKTLRGCGSVQKHTSLFGPQEMLNLEEFSMAADVNHANEPRSAFVEAMLSQGALLTLQTEVNSHWKSLLEHGPVLAALSALNLYSNLISNDETMDETGPLKYAVENLNLFAYLSELAKYGLDKDYLNAVGHKSVLLGFLASLLDLVNVDVLDQYSFGHLVDVFVASYEKSPLLAARFWSGEAQQSLKLFADNAMRRFPNDFVSFVRILTALSSNKETAQDAFLAFKEVTVYAELQSRVQSHLNIRTEEDMSVVALSAINLNLITIPSETKGRIVETSDMGDVIRWEILYSGWHLSFSILEQFLQQSSHVQLDSTRLPQVKALTAFLERLVSLDGDIPVLLNNFLLDVKPKHVVYKRIQSSVPLKLAELFESVTFAANADLPLLASILICINGFIDAEPRDAPALVRAIRPEQFRRILDTLECPSGEFPVCIASLGFVCSVLYSTLLWNFEDDSQSNVDIRALVNYITNHVWPLYDTWRYSSASQRHVIADKVLLIFDEILSDNFSAVHSKVSVEEPLKERLQSYLLHDSSFHANLLKIIGIGPTMMESRILEDPAEGIVLCGMVNTAFEILKRVLLTRANEKGPISSLENALLSRRPDGLDHVLTISLFINFVRDRKLVQSAVNVLTELCKLSASYQRPISLLGYFESRKMELRSQFLHRLGNRDEDLALRVAVVEFIATAIETQPGLATLFFLPRLKPEGEGDDDDLATRARLNNCVEIVSRFIIAEGKLTYARRPQVLASFLSLLAQLWHNAPQHAPIVAKFRKIPNFWASLVAFAQWNPNEIRASDGEENQVEFQSERLRVSAYVFEILMFEHFYVPDQSRLDKELAEKFATALQDPALTRAWINYYSASNFDEGLDARFHELCAEYKVKSSQLLTAEPQKRYGRHFQYDAVLLRRHLGFSPFEDMSDEDTGRHMTVIDRMDTSERSKVFIATVEAQNLQLSRLEAQLQAAQSWRRLAEVILLRHSSLGLFADMDVRFAAVSFLAKKLSIQQSTLKLMNREVAELLLVIARELTRKSLSLEKEDSSIEIMGHLENALKVALGAVDIDDRVVVSITTTILLMFTHAPRIHDKFWSTRFAGNAMLIAPHLLTVLRDVTAARVSAMSALTMVVQRVKSVEDLEHLVEAEMHSPLRLVLDILNEELKHMPLVESSAPPKKKEPKEPSATESDDADAMEVVEATGPELSSAALVLLITFSRSNFLAEALVNEGVMAVLRSDRLVAARFYPYTVEGKRSAWHQVWISLVRLATALLVTLGSNNRILEQIVDLVHVHEARFVTALTIPFHRAKDPIGVEKFKKANVKVEAKKNDDPSEIEVLSIGGLEELDAIVAFMYALGSHERHWNFAERDLANDHIKLMMNLLEWTVHLLSDTNRLAAFVVPVSAEEKKRMAVPKAEKSDKEAKAAESAFAMVARRHIHTLAVDAMAYLRMMLPIPLDESAQVKKQVRAFTPLFEATSSSRHPPTPSSLTAFSDEYSPPSMSLLHDYFKFLDSLTTSYETDKKKSRDDLPLIVAGLEQALYLVLTHVSVYLGPNLAAYHLAVATIVIEMNSSLDSMRTTFVSLNQEVKLLAVAFQYFGSLRDKYARRVPISF